jgi:predicted RNase H-like HicB family nuclease
LAQIKDEWGFAGRAGWDRIMKLQIVIHPAEEGGFWAEVPGFPGCVSEGETLDDVSANIREAFTGVIEAMQANGVVHLEDRTPADHAAVIDL